MTEIICKNCGTQNPETESLCIKCNETIGKSATIDPQTAAIAEGLAIQKAILRPTKPIMLIGIWLIFGIAGIANLIITGKIIYDGDLKLGLFVFVPLLIFCFFFPIKCTVNYLKMGNEKKENLFEIKAKPNTAIKR